MSCFVNGSLLTEDLPLCGCLTFLKANNSPGLQTGIVDLWTCAQCDGGPLCEVFLCTSTGSTCFAVVAGAEGVVILKEVSSCAICAIFLYASYWTLYWNCTGTASVANLAGYGRCWRYHLMYLYLFLNWVHFLLSLCSPLGN